MWVASPAFFAVVLLKVIWLGGNPAGEGSPLWAVPPQPEVSTKFEPSMEQCIKDGRKWELDSTVAALKGPLPVDNGVWKCVYVATGGLTI